ncbi:hypothetical protein CROQUDRAFT_108973 [Cronartium quercuum f. sp. fusiforme G11]|uniref:Uncharacterized protein n=1 Tax=Cronartium quercuum f. sp. fusiforme G11 TaxID=708437 RepID=A0A9P6TAM7_9BASI|nr:hypothetical protein CROQUDRAFT_108973 [Cronartium quercuum f. sp. fusiforme G11]
MYLAKYGKVTGLSSTAVTEFVFSTVSSACDWHASKASMRSHSFASTAASSAGMINHRLGLQRAVTQTAPKDHDSEAIEARASSSPCPPKLLTCLGGYTTTLPSDCSIRLGSTLEATEDSGAFKAITSNSTLPLNFPPAILVEGPPDHVRLFDSQKVKGSYPQPAYSLSSHSDSSLPGHPWSLLACPQKQDLYHEAVATVVYDEAHAWRRLDIHLVLMDRIPILHRCAHLIPLPDQHLDLSVLARKTAVSGMGLVEHLTHTAVAEGDLKDVTIYIGHTRIDHRHSGYTHSLIQYRWLGVAKAHTESVRELTMLYLMQALFRGPRVSEPRLGAVLINTNPYGSRAKNLLACGSSHPFSGIEQASDEMLPFTDSLENARLVSHMLPIYVKQLHTPESGF